MTEENKLDVANEEEEVVELTKEEEAVLEGKETEGKSELLRRVFKVESGSEDEEDVRPIGKELNELVVTEVSFDDIKKGDYFILVDVDEDGESKVFYNVATVEMQGVPIDYKVILWFADEEPEDGKQVDVQAALLENNEVQFLIDLVQKRIKEDK